MINNTSRAEDLQAKQEVDIRHELPKTTTSRQWGGFKNPRIVRVSQASGGKDRHSKVYTVKGLRDRRIRLSMPTAIQLYGLQDKLGLSQPSKVIDWLLDVTKDDIDKLPPLQMPPGDFSFYPPSTLNSPQLSFPPFFSTPSATFKNDGGNRSFLYTKQGIKLDHDHDMNVDHQRTKGKEVVLENKWNEQENGGLNFFPISQPSYPALNPYNSCYNWEPTSNLSLSQFGSSHASPLTSFALPSSSASQYFMRPAAATTSSFFPSYPMPTFGEHNDPIRQPNHFQFLSSSSPHVLSNSHVHEPLADSQKKVPFGLNMNSKFHPHKQ